MPRSLRFPSLFLLAVAAVVSAQTVRENVRVGLQSLRVDIRGRDGKPVPDVKASEIKLRVDGKDVTIEGLDPIAAAPGGAPASSPSSSGPTEIAPSAGPATQAAPISTASDIYLDVLYDETATNAYDRRDLFRQLETFLKEKTSAGVHVMLQRFNGHVITECPWTTDPGTAVDAMKKMQKKLSFARVPSPSDLQGEIANLRQGRDVQMQVDLAGRRTFEGVLQALVRFPEVPGKKGLVLVTDGTTLMTPYDLSLTLTSQSSDPRNSQVSDLKAHGDEEAAKQLDSALQQEALQNVYNAVSTSGTWAQRMAAITHKAVELDIAFYPVDSEALDRGTNPGTGSKWPSRSMPGVSMAQMSARVAVGQSMTALADATGGQSILAPLRMADRLGTIAQERSAGYILTFRDPAAGDGKYHTIDVSVGRPGAKLVYRRGYRVRSDDERTLDAVVAHLSEPTSDNVLKLRASFDVVGKESGRDIVQMKLEFEPTEAPGDTSSERKIQYWAVCSDDDGNRATPIVRKSLAQRSPEAKTATFTDSMQLGLPPGPYTWSVAVRDVATNVTSYVVLHKEL